ncbi:MAG: hypothetical protein WC824_05735 [Bacteroidota bacterium]|jgi:hypothetical protein
MELTFAALEDAFAPVEQIGKGELTIPVGSTTITLRPLLPEEESSVQKSAASEESPDGGTSGVSNAMEYIERFKVAVLSYAIVGVGDMDFHGVRFIETGETLKEGQKVKIPLHQAMRKIVLKWTNPVRTQIFRNYSDLLFREEKNAEEAIKYEPSDVATELERAKARVARLEEEMERRNKPISSGIVSQQVHSFAKGSEEEETETPKSEETPKPEETPPTVQTEEVINPLPPPPSARRVPTYPSSAPPPPSTVPHSDEKVQKRKVGDEVPDSFISPDDVEAIEAENIRLFEERMRQGRTLPPAPISSVIDASRERYGSRRAPHVGAAETSAEVPLEIPDETAALGRSEPEILGRRPDLPSGAPSAPVKDSRNPRFSQRKLP